MIVNKVADIHIIFKLLVEKIIICDPLRNQKNNNIRKKRVDLVVMFEAEIYFIIDDVNEEVITPLKIDILVLS